MRLKAPMPWFGGKRRIAPAVWERFGADVKNYVEPFFGSGAVLLQRPGGAGKIETVNDADGLLCNFWRALQADPEQTAHYADWPVNECDLQARHQWLVNRKAEIGEACKADPDWYDCRAAGWWVWGISCWIGGGWCAGKPTRQLPHLGDAGRGVHRKLPRVGGSFGSGSTGIFRDSITDLQAYFRTLADRLRRVRVCCGDWSRVMGPSVLWMHGLTAVFLDPPYSDAERCGGLYAQDSMTVAQDVRRWCLENGDNPLLRIALCGYESEHEMPATWDTFRWKAHGGYGLQGNNAARENRHREVVWFSPACLKGGLFDGDSA